MPTGLDLIGSNSALQEHWIKRVVAIFIDALLLGIVLFVLSIPFAIFNWGWVAWPFFWGVLFILYSTLLEATSGGATIGKPGMPAFGYHLTDPEIRALAAHVRALSAPR